MGAEGSIEVAGDDSWTRKPSLFIVVNPNGDAPIINQIKGDVRATTDIYVNLWVAKMKKHYIWTKIPINYEYKTDTSFAMIPLEVTVMEKDRNDFGPSTFHGSLPLLIEHFLEIGDYATDSEDSDAFVYPDMATQGGDMRLMISQSNQQDSLQWNEPKVITQTEGAIVSHDLMKIPGTSEYLAVWTEIAENDIDQTCPPSVIKYARSDSSLSSWTTPAEVTRLNDVAAYLELVRNGNDVALVTMNTTEGPMGINYRMDGFNWHNLTWSPAVNLVPTQEMIGMTACGTDYPSASLLTIAYVNKDHRAGWGTMAQ